MTQEHTPGPWTLGSANEYYPYETDTVYTIESGAHSVAEITSGYADSMANARLIAEAPEKFEVLEEWQHYFDNPHADNLIARVRGK